MAGKIKWYGYAGTILLLLSWAGNWFLPGLRTQYLFFSQWLGLILLLDAWVYARIETSLIHRNFKKFILLFFISIPVWWLFELLNLRNQNWYYLARDQFSDLQYFLFASLSFSTVMPAVFEMSELLQTFRWTKKLAAGPKILYSRKTAVRLIIYGAIGLMLDIWIPAYFFVFLWISLYFILEGVNILLNNRSLVQFTDRGNWRPVYLLALGCLGCGFLWEFWNYYSYPKWIYQIPFVGFAKVFEMPLMGYLGYIPFSFELYSIYMFISHTEKNDDPYLYIH